MSQFGRRGATRWVLVALVAAVISGLVGGGLALRHTSTADAAPASVLGWTPGVSAGMPITAPISVYFSRGMDHASVERAWRLSPAVPGVFHWTDTSVSFTPRSAYAAGSYYRLALGTGARDDQGKPLQNKLQVAFSTGDHLRVNAVTPAAGTRAVPVNGLLAITFNHPMVALAGLSNATPNPTGWELSMTPQTAGHGSWLGTSTWVFHPDSGFLPSSRYTISLRGARDAWGDPLPHPVTWSFRTIGPEVIAEQPAAGTAAANPDGTVDATFNQPMNHATATAFSLRAGGVVSGSTSWRGNTLLFQPDHSLNPAVRYVARIDASARSLTGEATLARPVSWTFRVARPPSVVSTTPVDHGVALYDSVSLQFSVPMREATIDRRLTIDPPLPGISTKLGSPNADPANQSLYNIFGQFEPSTRYTVTVAAGATDTFGRKVESPYVFHFTTAPLDPSVVLYGAPGSGPGVSFTAGSLVQAPVQVVNVHRVHYSLIRIGLQGLASSTLYGNNTVPAGTTIRDWVATETTPVNRVGNRAIPLTTTSGAPLPPGLYWLGARATANTVSANAGSGFLSASELVVSANTGITLTCGNGTALAWITSSATGRPLAGVPVGLIDQNSKVSQHLRTDASGLALFRFSPDSSPTGAVVDDGRHFGLTTSGWSPPVQTGGVPMDASGRYVAPPSGTYAYTDRPIYRPGQTVHFRALLWRDDDGVYSHLGARTVQVSATDGNNHQVYARNVQLDPFGSVHGYFSLPTGASTGYGSLNVVIPGQEAQFGSASTSFVIAAFRKPEFLTAVTTDRGRYVQGDTIHATVHVKYVFGAPVAGQPVTWTASRQDRVPQPPGWDGFQFGDLDALELQSEVSGPRGYGPRSQSDASVAQGSGTTDARGELAINVPVDLAKQLLDQTMTIEATTTDVNGQSVSGRVQVPADHAAIAIGLSASQQVLPVYQSEQIDIAAVTQAGRALAAQSLTVHTYRRTYTSELANNGLSQAIWHQVPHDAPLNSQTMVTDAQGHATLHFTPDSGGEYRVVVTARDGSNDLAQSALSVYASAAGFSDYGASSSTVISVKADKATYRVGDTAHLLIAAPFSDASALITVARGTLRSYRVQVLHSNSSTINVKIGPHDLPNVFVSVALYRGTRNGSPPDWRFGTARLKVRVDPARLIVRLTQNRSHFHPGERVTYTVTTTDSHGHPVPAEVSLALVDTALLALQEEINPDVVRAFYGETPLGVTVSSNGVASIDHLQAPPGFAVRPLGGLGGGGGGPGGPIALFDTRLPGGKARVRQHFEDTAYWTAHLVTDAAGLATITLTLPDNLTTWRLDARAVSADFRVGQAQLSTLSTQDVVLRPVLPRFFLIGDSVRVGAVLNNNLNESIAERVSLDAVGLSLASSREQSVSVPPHGERLVLWQARVRSGSVARLTLGATGITGGVQGDAVQSTVPVHPPLTDETVSAAGQVFGSVRQYVMVPAGARAAPGDLSVQVSSAITAGMGRALDDMVPCPCDSNDDIAARLLAVSSLRKVPARLSGLGPVRQQSLSGLRDRGVRQLLARQLPDGGWPWFSGAGAQSDPLITADVVEALARSGAGGSALAAAVQRGSGFLRTAAAVPYGQSRPTSSTLNADERAHLMAVIALSTSSIGGVQGLRTAAEALYSDPVQRAHLSAAGLADLAITLRGLNDVAFARTLVAGLDAAAMVSATGAHWETSGGGFGADSAVSATTRVLNALLAVSPGDTFVPAAARWLMLARQGTGWDSARDSAHAIAALARYTAASSEGNSRFSYRVVLDGQQALVAQGGGAGGSRSALVALPIGRLKRGGTSALEVDRLPQHGTMGTGPLYYVARLRYYLPAASIAPRNQGISVSRRYLSLSGQPLESISAGSLVRVEITLGAAQTLTHLDVQDPIPAGFEPLDPSLQTSRQGLAAPPAPPAGESWLEPYLTHTDLRDDRIALHADSLPPGTYVYSYVAQATLAGSYAVAPIHATEAFFPEVFGRGAGSTFTVK